MKPLADNPARHAEVGLCVLLAAADGDVSDREVAALSTRLGSLTGDDFPAIALAAIVDAEILTMSELGPDRYVDTLVARLPVVRRAAALRGALVIACIDGLAPEEERMFRDVASALGIDGPATEEMLASVQAR